MELTSPPNQEQAWQELKGLQKAAGAKPQKSPRQFPTVLCILAQISFLVYNNPYKLHMPAVTPEKIATKPKAQRKQPSTWYLQPASVPSTHVGDT